MLIDLLAKRLPYSDHIVCLSPKGSITAQGTFDDLNNAGGYVSSFSLPRADWAYVPSDGSDDDEDITNIENEREDITAAHLKEIHSGTSFTSTDTTIDHHKETDTSRQTGDIQIYLYYVKSVGWWPSLIFVTAIVGFVFCMSFPSKWISSSLRALLLL
jgi:ATP-binding cassette subfamily C (CFTR/MRP) protein 1